MKIRLIIASMLVAVSAAVAGIPFSFWGGVGRVPTPTFNPDGGDFSYCSPHVATVSVTISDSNTNALLFYTKDGTTPCHTGASVCAGNTSTTKINSYTGSTNMGTGTLKALAYVNGKSDSLVYSAAYNVTVDVCGGT